MSEITATMRRMPRVLVTSLRVAKIAGFALLFVAVVGSALIYSGLRFSGVSLYTVQSPSMKPAFGPGDVVGVKSVAPWDVKVGDVVAYRRPDTPLPVIHRVKEINWVGYDVDTIIKDKNGKVVETSSAHRPREFVFQGDNNPTVDPDVVQQSQIVGRMALEVPEPFNLVATRFSRQSLITFGVGAILLYITWELADGLIEFRRRRRVARLGNGGLEA